MCGRFTLRTPASELVEIFKLLRKADWTPRYNIAPTQSVAVIRQTAQGRELSRMHWGLIPAWSRDPKMGGRLINARAETVASKPSFRDPFRKRRCLIPADGFYEWKDTGGKTKQPYYISLRDGRPFAFAGLWEHWEGADAAIESCTIITVEANELLRELHDRMPVILHPTDYDRWLELREPDTGRLQSLLVPYESDEMTFNAVSTVVNSPRNDSPACTEILKSPGTM